MNALEASYQAIARVELAAGRAADALSVSRRYGPPEFFYGSIFNVPSVPAHLAVADPLIVSRVVLQSPGFWEFFGSLNPLEVLRKYLNDRHERKKDDDYRSAAERDRLEIENAIRRLELVQRLKGLEREHSDLYSSEAWLRVWGAEIGPPLRELADMERRGLISGASAATGTEPVERDDPTAPQ